MAKKELSHGEKLFFGWVVDLLKYGVFIPAIKEIDTSGFGLWFIIGLIFIVADLYAICKTKSLILIVASLFTGEILEG